MKITPGTFQPIKGFFSLLIIYSHTRNLFGGIPPFSFQMHPWRGLLSFLLDICFYTVMPGFFIICGYGFRKMSLRRLVRNNLLPVIKGYLITTVILLVFATLQAILLGRDISQAVVPQFLGFVLMNLPTATYFGVSVGNVGMMWFACVLVLASILLNCILRLNSRWVQGAICLVLAAAGVLLKDVRLPFCLQQTCVCCSFMYIGYMMRQEKLLEKKPPWYSAALVFLFFVYIVSMENHRIDISVNSYQNGLLGLITAWIIGTATMYLFIHLSALKGKWIDLLAWIGQNSFIVFCVHHVERQLVNWNQLSSLVTDNRQLQQIVIFLLRTFICLIITYIAVQCAAKVQLRTTRVS